MSRWCGALVGRSVLVLTLVSSGCGKTPEPAGTASEGFLETHWRRPVPPLGQAPPDWTVVETSLDPKSCALCHAPQYADWSGAHHSKAMSPGLLGQLLDMDPEDREGLYACVSCHAPLSEQVDSLIAVLTGELPPRAGRERPLLHEHGVTCAVCHVRNYRFYGPPRRSELGKLDDDVPLPHGGWESRSEFADSRFCASCHQFEPGDLVLNGKYLENTYEEWQASRYAREGTTCQSCHMPDRRHLFRGIHDPGMVRQGVTVEITGPVVSADSVLATLSVTNSAVGHYFPTYVTPWVYLEGYQIDAAGGRLDPTWSQFAVARSVSMSIDEEYFDTRIPPGGTRRFEYAESRHADADSVVLRVRVRPDYFYTRFYEAYLDGGLAVRGSTLIQQALTESRASEYVLEESRFSAAPP